MREAARPHGPPQPLAGASVVVTRPAASAAALKRRIVALGGVAIGVPGIGLRGAEDADAARKDLHAACSADMVVFVSPNAVRYAYALLPKLRFARGTQVCAIGSGTGNALARRGVREILLPQERQDSEGLLALAPFARVRGRRIVLIAAPGGRELLHEELRRRGAKVACVDVYRRTAPRLDRRHFAALEGAATPLFALLSSAEAIAHLRARLPAASFVHLSAGCAIASSARIADAARAAGWRDIHLARSANAADLCEAAVAVLAQHRM
jgi:uroporphyrinogen-III synthase